MMDLYFSLFPSPHFISSLSLSPCPFFSSHFFSFLLLILSPSLSLTSPFLSIVFFCESKEKKVLISATSPQLLAVTQQIWIQLSIPSGPGINSIPLCLSIRDNEESFTRTRASIRNHINMLATFPGIRF